MSYTYTLPTLKLPSGDVVITFYSTGLTATTQTLSNSYILSLDEINNEVENKGADLFVGSVDIELWDKDAKFRNTILDDVYNGYNVKVTITLAGSVVHIGVIDKKSISIEQKYVSITGTSVVYAVESDSMAVPVEVLSFTSKDIISLLETIKVDSLIQSIDLLVASDIKWAASNGIKSSSLGSQDFYFIPIKQVVREILNLLPPSTIKIGVQIQDDIISAMSRGYFDTEEHYHLGAAGGGETLNNIAVKGKKGLDDLYLIYNRTTDGKGHLFTSGVSSDGSTTIPSDSLYNLNNCLEVLGKIIYTFGLVLVSDYTKKSIASASLDSYGVGYSSSTYTATLTGGGGTGGVIKALNTFGLPALDSIIVTNNGENYTSAPDIVIPPPSLTGQATATAVVSSSTTAITGFTITNYGGYYNEVEPPDVYIDPPPAKRTAIGTAFLTNGVVSSCVIEDGNGGSGYVSGTIPSVIVTPAPKGSGNSDAVVVVSSISDGEVKTLSVTSGGSGYINPPTIRIGAPPDTIQATATANVNGFLAPISSLSIGNAGRGYKSTNPPIVLISPPNLEGQASATCSLSDFDIYLKERTFGNLDANITADILSSDIEIDNDSYIDEYSISTQGYDDATTELKLNNFPSSNHNGSTIFGLQHSNGVNYGSLTDNFLVIPSQYKYDATTLNMTENNYQIAKYVHSGDNLFLNSRLLNSNNWTLAGSGTSHTSTDGVNYGGGEEVITTGFFTIKTYTTSVGIPNYIIGNLNKTIYGEPLIFCAFMKKSANCNIGYVAVELLDSSNNVIKFKNIHNTIAIDVDIPPKQLNDTNWYFVNLSIEPLDLISGISKIKIYFTRPDSGQDQPAYISYPQIFVGAETMSMWLVNKYRKLFSGQGYRLTRKYDGLTNTNIKIGDYITDNGQNYYIKKITKNLTDNETEIEAINYTNL